MIQSMMYSMLKGNVCYASTAVLRKMLLYRVERRKRMFFKWLVLGKGGVDDVGLEPADSSDIAVSVAMGHWNIGHCVFDVEQFFLETVIP